MAAIFRGVFVSSLLLISGAGSPWSLKTYPNPVNKISECGPQGLDRVCDPEFVVASDEQRLEIQKAIYGIEHEVPHGCASEQVEGYQFAVALARSIEGGKDAAGAMARGLHDAWGVGRAACNDGAVLLLSIDDRQAFVSTGSGVKEILTDDHVQVNPNEVPPPVARSTFDCTTRCT
jgi:hypothetical protein